MHLARYGQQVRVPLLISATVAMIGGFALLNQGLYETVGRGWYQVADERREPVYVDFLAYALTNLLGLVDVLDLAKSHHCLGEPRTSVKPRGRPPTLLAGFKAFFTLVLLQQIFASLRQGKLLAETITDFWSPHEPIHERARNALPQLRGRGHRAAAGVAALGPVADQGATGPAAADPGDDRPLDHPGPGPSPARPARARAGHRRRRARPAPRPGHGALAGRARPGPQRRGAAERGRSAGGPRRRCDSARPHADAASAGAAGRGGAGSGGCSGGESAADAGVTSATRSSWPWRRWSRPWPTTRRRCGPRPPWRWAGSVRPPRRWPLG